MIVFKSIQWSNFLSTGSAGNKVILNESPSVLVVGKNGEGKSTMLDAICFALFGKPFRNINKNQLINSINKKNCSVEVHFTIASRDYKVIRGIKPNIFEIWVDGNLINSDAALKDYQKVLEQQILKLNYKTFTQVVILGSSSFVPFMQLPTGQRREVIEDILDIRIFTLMNQLLKEKVSDTKDQIGRIESQISAERVKIEAQKKLIETLESTKSDMVSGLLKKHEDNQRIIELSQSNVNTKTLLVNQLKLKLADKAEVDMQLKKANALKAAVDNKVETCSHQVEFFETNETCPTCTQHINDEYKSKVLADMQHKLKDNEMKLELLKAGMEKLQKRLTEMADVANEITDLNIGISTELNTINILNKQNVSLYEEINSVKEDKSNIDDEKAKMKLIATEAMRQIDIKTSLQESRKIQDIAALLLKDTGIKTAIIKEYLPAMNKLINKYLTSMDFYVSFELDENFDETIKSRHRDEFTYASFSEGEKMRIDLAILFTWRQIAKMKNSVNTNLLILDEVFDSSLDTTGTDYFLNIMNSFGEKTNVFVISHKGDQLVDKFHSIIKFEKKNDFSVMSTA